MTATQHGEVEASGMSMRETGPCALLGASRSGSGEIGKGSSLRETGSTASSLWIFFPSETIRSNGSSRSAGFARQTPESYASLRLRLTLPLHRMPIWRGAGLHRRKRQKRGKGGVSVCCYCADLLLRSFSPSPISSCMRV